MGNVPFSITEKAYNPFEQEEEDHNLNEIKNKTHPIFYDPNRTVSIKLIEKNDTTPSQINSTENNPILQIWKGNLTLFKVNLKNIMLCSTDSMQLFSQFSNFPKDLQISSKGKTKEVTPYVEKCLSNLSKPTVCGWLEITDESQIELYQKLADEYEKHDRTGFYVVNDTKLYIFSLSPRYYKFYKRMKNDIKIHNKKLMSRLDKYLVFALINSKSENEIVNPIKPIILIDEIERNASEKLNMSPITSDEEGNAELNEEGTIEGINNDDNGRDATLEELLRSDDPTLLEEYVNNNFANLSQEEIIGKLITLDEESRVKLLNLIMDYQQKNQSGGVQTQNENQEEEVHIIESSENFVSSGNDNVAYMAGYQNVNIDMINKNTNQVNYTQQQNMMRNMNPQFFPQGGFIRPPQPMQHMQMMPNYNQYMQQQSNNELFSKIGNLNPNNPIQNYQMGQINPQNILNMNPYYNAQNNQYNKFNQNNSNNK